MQRSPGDGACDSEGCAEAAPQSGLPESQTIQNHLASGSESDAEFRQNMIRYARNKCMAYLATREEFPDWFSRHTMDPTMLPPCVYEFFKANNQMPSGSAAAVSEEDASHSTTTYYPRFGGAAENCRSSPQTTMIGDSNAHGGTFESPADVSTSEHSKADIESKYKIWNGLHANGGPFEGWAVVYGSLVSIDDLHSIYKTYMGQSDDDFLETCAKSVIQMCRERLTTREAHSNEPIVATEVSPHTGAAMQTTTMTIDMASNNAIVDDEFHGDGGWARFGGSAENLKSSFEHSATVQSEEEDEERPHWNAS